jgi:hypothetical protein
MKSACASQAVEFAQACRREVAGNLFREITSPISAFSLLSRKSRRGAFLLYFFRLFACLFVFYFRRLSLCCSSESRVL